MHIKSLFTALVLSTAMTIPVLAQARTVNLTANLAQYGGPNAYLAIYLTDSSGAYAGSLWMAGGRSRYYRHLTDWARFTGGDPAAVNGITGASIGSGSSMNVSVEMADSLFDAGYTLHIDAAAEEMRESPNEVSVQLTTAGAGKTIKGRRYISNFRYGF